MDSDINKILSFLSDWKSNKEIKECFSLTQGQFYRLSRWMLKANLIIRCGGNDIGSDTGTTTYYKAKNN